MYQRGEGHGLRGLARHGAAEPVMGHRDHACAPALSQSGEVSVISHHSSRIVEPPSQRGATGGEPRGFWEPVQPGAWESASPVSADSCLLLASVSCWPEALWLKFSEPGGKVVVGGGGGKWWRGPTLCTCGRRVPVCIFAQ